MTTKRRGTAILAGMAVTVAAGVAWGYFDDWLLWNEPSTIEIEHDVGLGSQGPVTNLQVHRGPVVSGEQALRFDLSIQAVGVLNYAKLLVADDDNDNGILDESEWVTVSVATISEAGGVTTASTTDVLLPISRDGYRVEYDRSDIGLTQETWVNTEGIDLPEE